MTDIYRTSALICPACASPMREFHKRLVCDACEGMMIEVDDFQSACADLIGDAAVELFDREPSKAERKPVCPRCSQDMTTCRVRIAGKKMKGRFSTCDRDGLWFGRDVLPGVFAVLTRTFIGYTGGYDAVGGHTRKQYQAVTQHDASQGLTIARWRNRPRKRSKTLSPVNAYRDQKLLCPACRTSELHFMGDRYGCDTCRGLFVETAALVAMVSEMTDAPWEPPAPTGAPGGRACPICTAAMIEEKLDGAAIDRCAAHGVWFDPPELEQVLQGEDEAAKPGGIRGWLRRIF